MTEREEGIMWWYYETYNKTTHVLTQGDLVNRFDWGWCIEVEPVNRGDEHPMFRMKMKKVSML